MKRIINYVMVSNSHCFRAYVIYLFLFISTYCYGQYGYKSSRGFINLTPMDTSICYVQTPKEIDSLKLSEETKNNITKLPLGSDNSEIAYLVDTIIKKNVGIKYESTMYRSTHGFNIIILPKIVLAVTEKTYINSIINAVPDKLFLKKDKGNYYILGCNCKTSQEVLNLSTAISHMEGVKWCKPGMLVEIKPQESFFSLQYYLKANGTGANENIIGTNVIPAWNSVTGSPNITVAVIDCGVEHNHEDLQGVVLDGYTCGYPNSKGEPVGTSYTFAHGTACAGIIAAKNNDTGITGVAYGVRVLPINIHPTSMCEPEDIAEAISWAASHGADIFSISYAFEDDPNIQQAIESARLYGRNGKGIVVVAASGNNYLDGYTEVIFPACMDNVVAVGAVNQSGSVCEYSQRGTELNIVAPSGSYMNYTSPSDIVTTDRMGNIGYQTYGDWNYYKNFRGTSASCPQVAGIAALILSVDSTLSESSVRSILLSTARKLPGMNNAYWTEAYGFGLVDANAAINVASYWQQCHNCSLAGPTMICSSSSGVYTMNGVPSNVSVTWSFTKTYGTYTPTLSPNASNNTCTIYNSSSTVFEGDLVATLKVQGYTVASYYKHIYGDANIYGFYWDGEPYDNYHENVLTEDDNYATPGHVVLINSPNFKEKSFQLYKSSTPNSYTLPIQHGNDFITFEMPYLSNGETYNIKVTGGCNDEVFIFRESDNYRLNRHSLEVSKVEENLYNLRLPAFSDSVEISDKATGSKAEEHKWYIQIYNMHSFQMITKIKVHGEQYLLDVTSLSPGVYAIVVDDDSKKYMAKITVK